MPITSWLCVCGAGEVQLEHFATCPESPMPYPLIRGIVRETLQDERHPPNVMSASRLGDCPRAAAILDNLPVPRVNPLSFASAASGWAKHDWLARNTPIEWRAERLLTGVLWRGTPYEIVANGHPDVLVPVRFDKDVPVAWRVEDYKTTSESSQRWVAERKQVKVEWIIQLSVYAALGKQQSPPLDIVVGKIWSGADVAQRNSKAAPWIPIACPLVSEEVMLALRPGEGDATLGELLLEWKRFQEERAVCGGPAIAKMSLAGESMWRSAKTGEGQRCSYCTASEVCGRIERERRN